MLLKSTALGTPGDPFCRIQDAINGASGGDEVVVALGEYFENINFNGKAITVRSTAPTVPGTILGTIINGGGADSVVKCRSGEGPDTVLSGFLITNGGGGDGGGMHNIGSSPTVSNCSFSGNFGEDGGGMANQLGSNPTVTNCTFTGNLAWTGGGMSNHEGSPTVTNCTFSGNTAFISGGGMFGRASSSPTVTNCTFSGNTAFTSGGGMYSKGSSNPTVTNSVICRNTPPQVAGDPIVDGGGNAISDDHCVPIPPPMLGDLDKNGDVDLADFAIFALRMTGPV